ncbi:MAG TPA: SDR family oxidoreductase [Steroidobacter sp.]|uniref:SDR family oxidoreductase n=1 Tax=Steroidobacter sp. TaxID=1978227 RepID=UPI002ED90E05
MAAACLETLFALHGKTALVTGGAQGIGRMLAEVMLRAGAQVLITSREEQVATDAAARLNALNATGAAMGLAADISTEEGVVGLAQQVRGRCDRLSILVNNAGRTWGAALDSFPHHAWQSVFAVNVAGLFTLTRELLPVLKNAASAEDPARVVNIGSIAGSQPVSEGAYSYAASKAAVHHLTRILAKELISSSITVNAIAPGLFVTRMTAFATTEASSRERVAQNVPARRLGCEQDLAGALLFLCGRGGAYVTGSIIPVDGGLSVDCSRPLWAGATA